MSVPNLAVELAINPVRVSGNSELEIRGAVRNLGSADLDTRIEASALLVNGEPSGTWVLAIGNGPRDKWEFALPPGQRVEFRRLLPASSLLRGPGRYELILDVGGVRSAPVTIECQ